MPTEHQVKATFELVKKLCPDARIKAVGPDGVTFLYPDEINPTGEGPVNPFSA